MAINDQFEEARRRFMGAQNADEIYRVLVSSAREYLNCDDCRVAIADGDVLVPTASVTETIDPKQTIPLSYGIAGQTYTNQQAGIVNDITFTRDTASDQSESNGRSVLSIPLDDYGVFQAIAHERAAFTETHRIRLERLIDDALVALDRIHTTSASDGGSVMNFEKIVTHELRSPLTVAQGRLELVQTDIENEHLDDLEAALSRADEILSNLDTLAEIVTLRERTIPAAERTPTEIEDVASEGWSATAPEEATLEIVGTCRVLAYPRYLQYVFENLLRNAVEHAGPEVTVRVGLLDERTGWYVADDGPGIPVSEREAIFDPGYSNSGSGSGLGLSIVSQIIDVHGWEITATDSEAGGARFEISNVDRPD